MDWLQSIKKTAAAAANTMEATLKETGVAERLAPVTQAAGEGASLFKSFGTSLETSFNAETAEQNEEKPGKEVSLDKVGPPWVTSHMGLKAYENDIKSSILKITEGEDSVVFERLMEQPLDEDFEFDWLEPSSTARAMAALEGDPRLAAARKRIVPGKVKEDAFWRNYFYRCDTVVKSYLNMTGNKRRQDPKAQDEARYPDASDNLDMRDDGFENVEFVSEGTVEQKIAKVESQEEKEGGLSWEEEMAKELDGVGAPEGGGGEGDDDELDDFEKELGNIK